MRPLFVKTLLALLTVMPAIASAQTTLQPAITSVSPSFGPVEGGTTVVLDGTDLKLNCQLTCPVSRIFFGNVEGKIIGDHLMRLIVVTPPHSAGVVDIRLVFPLVSPNGPREVIKKNAFQFGGSSNAPTISSLTPASGPASGGTRVTITGTYLNSNFCQIQCTILVVSFGGAPAVVESVKFDELVVITPPHVPGSVDVKVSPPGVDPVTSVGAFTYHDSPPTVSRLVATFSQDLPGINRSRWQSELRFFNRGTAVATVSARLHPWLGNSCSGFPTFTLAPGQLVQLRTVGCGPGSNTAIELQSVPEVDILSVTTNVRDVNQDPCCLSGFATTVPAREGAYSARRSVHNLQVARNAAGESLARHNLGVINPNSFGILVKFRIFSSIGLTHGVSLPNLAVPARTTIQLADVLNGLSLPSGYWRIEAVNESTAGFGLYDTAIDNTTNDVTYIESM
ncbi:MAG TPA: IPT/TIG domain-containing protein [Thermoanaerobaculia bacterium]|nr:IPT/TIG domain-containing protein [Thermoanaerobaculia bacterium]